MLQQDPLQSKKNPQASVPSSVVATLESLVTTTNSKDSNEKTNLSPNASQKRKKIEDLDQDALISEAKSQGLISLSEYNTIIKKRKASAHSSGENASKHEVLDEGDLNREVEQLLSLELFEKEFCVCSLSKRVLKHPVLAENGVIYDKQFLDSRFNQTNGLVCPIKQKGDVTFQPFKYPSNLIEVGYIKQRCEKLIEERIDKIIHLVLSEQGKKLPPADRMKLVTFALDLTPNIERALELKSLIIDIIEKDEKSYLLKDEDTEAFIGMLIDICSIISKKPSLSEEDRNKSIKYYKKIIDRSKNGTLIQKVYMSIFNTCQESLDQLYDRTLPYGENFFEQIASFLLERKILSFETLAKFKNSKLKENYQTILCDQLVDRIQILKSNLKFKTSPPPTQQHSADLTKK
ncbi:hypothetical protein C9374_007214 [Naegleria lovaniensis]|uniref:U-box domain-containing protein n=1 Tax=Naegleria lovaniensis TaxID=51637 RepID=A0AA88KPY1_NAELO|nr:uncharacterized protein C9374_007214 [Naegleria lovaniensis]KAG2393683.1 hypothetical protein C9374_007214 [Naegleria lovaniensis]